MMSLWAVNCNEIVVTVIRNDYYQCVQQPKGVCSSFLQNTATYCDLNFFYLIKRTKVKFKSMSLTEDDILIHNHVTDILNIQ